MIKSIHCRASVVGALALLSMLAAWGVARGAGRQGAGLCGHCRRAGPQRRRPANRSAPPARQNARLHRRQGRNEGARYGGRRRLQHRTAGARRRRRRRRVYAQESAAVMERVKDKFDIRAQNPAMKNVVHVIRNYDDPIPPEVGGLDLITFFFAYHDVTYMPVDRAEMNKKMFAALKPGGFLVIADHSARPAMASMLRRRCIASRKARCARRSRRPASSSSARPISCAIPKIRATRRCSVRRFRSTSSC